MYIGSWKPMILLFSFLTLDVTSFGFDFSLPWPSIFWNEDTLIKKTDSSPKKADNVENESIQKYLSKTTYTTNNNVESPKQQASAKKKGQFSEFLQRDDVDSGQFDDPNLLPPNSCTRHCRSGEKRVCYYKFYLEPYSTLGWACQNCLKNESDCLKPDCVTADGFERAILTVNRRLPGPSIQVCEGDTIVVDVINMMNGRSTTIHWHGQTQKRHKFMDGVPFVTQCPIHEGTSFRYSFEAEAGTYFYHSHDGLQKVDGLVGSLVVRKPKSKDHKKKLYDFDLPSHVIVVQDWYHLTADAMFPGLRFKDKEQMATSYLIQGRGQYKGREGEVVEHTPLAQFKVTQGYRYRFRIIAGTCYECQFVLTIEGHDFIIIEADGGPTQPYTVNSLTMSPGERYSVVVNADRPISTYWVGVRAVGLCAHMKAHQVATLRYQGGPQHPPTKRPDHLESESNRVGVNVSPVNSKCTPESLQKDGPCLQDLRAAEDTLPAITAPQPDLRIIWVWDFYRFPTSQLFGQGLHPRWLQSPYVPVGSTVNGIVYRHPPSPLLSQSGDVPQDLLCAARGNFSSWKADYRECVHVIKVPAHSVLEIISVNNASFNPNGIAHPIHLHGYDMHVIEQGVMKQNVSFNRALEELIEYLDSEYRREIPSNPVTKDTYALTAGGYTVTRIFTDNLGYWFFHCHFAYHLDSGMSGVLQVGDTSDFPPPPPGFPKCGTYEPD